MKLLTLADILEALTGIRPVGADLVITEATIDSRLTIPGSLFVALPGERVDGHTYVGDAFHKGANIALIQKDLSSLFPVLDLTRSEFASHLPFPKVPFCILVENTLLALQQIARFWRSKLDIRVVGITGSVGKSTTKELVADVLTRKGRTLRNPGNLNNEIGLPLTLLRLGSGYQHAVLEMGFLCSRGNIPALRYCQTADRGGHEYRYRSRGESRFAGCHRQRQSRIGPGAAGGWYRHLKLRRSARAGDGGADQSQGTLLRAGFKSRSLGKRYRG